ncbi:MAG: undecaprenyldiphospho-muramoylpentapeptide beta-N-acetylglucosaminyltransferase [Bacteroidaceae bacterium]|nr:undecaprenyldiphospho-muramoylpentapeptide beta-N-acetylglucosaminyltransferase [Bacteroidaceae bacterium]
MNNSELRVIISGGGTGGHIFPAVSIANALREANPGVKILFVGAEGRMEMQRVPAAGYEIIGLPVRGLLRPLWKPGNISILIDFLKSKRMVKQTLREFKPHVAVGVGGYASSATLNAAYELGIPCLIQEQNSYAGLTNKTLAKKARKICVAYEGMERFFPKDCILLTGNPVRQNLFNPSLTREECAAAFGLNPSKPTILLVGGSLGARTLNESVIRNLSRIAASSAQFIWQTGSYYSKEIEQTIDVKGKPGNLVVTDFISRMDQAYCLADLVISRAGAGTISELCLLGKPAILVPSPNVAEDHQTHNAMALVNKQAALFVRDAEAPEKLIPLALETVVDSEKLQQLGKNAAAMALRDSARIIAEEVMKLAEQGSVSK